MGPGGRAFGQASPAHRLEAKQIYQGVIVSPHAVDATLGHYYHISHRGGGDAWTYGPSLNSARFL